MTKSFSAMLIVALLATGCAKKENSAPAKTPFAAPREEIVADNNAMDELDPFAPGIEQQLQEMDAQYAEQTGMSPFLNSLLEKGKGCVRETCTVWLQVVKSQQKAYLHLDGVHTATWDISTGAPGHETPNFDTHPNGRIYDSYTSTKWPGGDYKSLGNMPYAVFIQGGFAVHGTGQGNWKRLGNPASHGCIRMHPDNAYTFNRLVRQYGIYKIWVTVHQ